MCFLSMPVILHLGLLLREVSRHWVGAGHIGRVATVFGGGIDHHTDPGQYWDWKTYMNLVSDCVKAAK